MNVEKVILIDPNYVDLARRAAIILSPIHGAGMFQVPVYDFSGNIHYYISSGWIDDGVIPFMTNANTLYNIVKSFATLSDCIGLISTGIVSDTPPYDLLAELGLTLFLLDV